MREGIHTLKGNQGYTPFVGRRTRVILIVLILAGAGIVVASVLRRPQRPTAFVLDQTIPVHREDRPEQAAFVPGRNSVLFGARYKPITLFDLTTGTSVELFTDQAHGSFALSADGVSAAVELPGPELQIYDLASRKVRQTFHCVSNGGRESLAWSPDGRWIALGDKRTIEVLDVQQGASHSLSTGIQDDSVNSVAFSPDGRLLGVGTWQGVVSMWRTDSWRLSQEFELGSDPQTGRNGMCSVAFSRDSSLFAAGGGYAGTRLDGSSPITSGALRVWRTSDRTMILSMDLKEAAASLSFSPDGTMLAYSTWGRVQVVELGTGKEIWSQGHAALGMNPAVAFGRDGRLLTLDANGPIRIWKRSP